VVKIPLTIINMKKKNKKSLKTASLKVSKVAVFCLIVGVFGIIGGIFTNSVLAVIWMEPSTDPHDIPADLEPPINTSLTSQEKKGGLYIATQDGGLGIGTTVIGGNKLQVDGTTALNGIVSIQGDLTVSSTAVMTDLTAGDMTVVGDLTANGGMFNVDSDNDKISINTGSSLGKLNIATGDESGIVSLNTSSSYASIQGINNSLAGGTGIYGYGFEYGVWGYSSVGYGVLADARDSGIGGLYARGSDTRYGAVGRGLYGVVGFDTSADVDSPVFNGPAGTLAGLFQGSVEIVPSYGGNGDLTVDTDTFVVNSSTNRVGIGVASPIVKLHTVGVDDQSVIYAQAGTNTMWDGYDGSPTAIVAGVYGEGGTITYPNGGDPDIGWNFGVFGKAGDPGTGRSVGVMGVGFEGGGDTYAGWFDGYTKVEGQLSIIGPTTIEGSAEISGDIIGYSDLNLTGDINMDLTADSDITLTGSIDAGGDITYMGKLIMTGGLPALEGGTSCDVSPSNYAEGTMFVCYYCASPSADRTHAVMVRMNGVWKSMGSVKGDSCAGPPYVPELPS